jgi:hypothetical protein
MINNVNRVTLYCVLVLFVAFGGLLWGLHRACHSPASTLCYPHFTELPTDRR